MFMICSHQIVLMERTACNGSRCRERKLISPYMFLYYNLPGLYWISCKMKNQLTFDMARHAFATTVTLMNGVPIESISKMLGHSKITTTMIYARVSQSKIGMDMMLLQNKLDENK